MVKVKRIYVDWDRTDGFRVLVDRLWPRGISKEKAHIDLWLKDIAPSNELRRWFQHDPKKWEEFRKSYIGELKQKQDLINKLKKNEEQHRILTLLYAAKDEEHNEAIVLADFLANLFKL